MNMRIKNLLTILPTTSVIIFESQKVSPSEYLLFPKLSSDRRVARRSAGPYSSKKLPFMKSSNVNTVSSRNDNFSNFLKLVNLRLLHLLIFWLITKIGAIKYLLVSAPVGIRSALVLKEKPISLFLKLSGYPQFFRHPK